MQGCRFIGPVLVVGAFLLQVSFLQEALQFSDVFVNEPFHYLNVDRVRSSQVMSAFECAHDCLGETLCLSFNLAALRLGDTLLLCELLASDKYNAPEQLEPSQEFHHFSIMVSVSIHRRETVFRIPPQIVQAANTAVCIRAVSAGYHSCSWVVFEAFGLVFHAFYTPVGSLASRR